MTNMKILNFIVIAIIISSCASFGTKTISKSSALKTFELKKIGYSQMASEDILDKIIPGTSTYFYNAIDSYYSGKQINIEKHLLLKFNDLNEIDTSEIKNICKQFNLDGFLCTQLKYKFVDNYYLMIPLGKSEDTFTEMKLFDKNGNLILHTKHNTAMGNSYMKPPKADKTVKDGIFGALKRIDLEILKSKQ